MYNIICEGNENSCNNSASKQITIHKHKIWKYALKIRRRPKNSLLQGWRSISQIQFREKFKTVEFWNDDIENRLQDKQQFIS